MKNKKYKLQTTKHKIKNGIKNKNCKNKIQIKNKKFKITKNTNTN